MTNPIPAMKRAFTVLKRPDTKLKFVYVLTDGEFADGRAVIEELRKLNADRSVSILTILYKVRRPEPEDFLRTIAKEHSGKFKSVSVFDWQHPSREGPMRTLP